MGYVSEMRKKIGRDRLLIVGAGVLLCRGGEILLQKRRDNGCWAIHGGCTEPGETVEDTARRELREETGLIAGRLTLFGVFSGAEMDYEYPNGDKVSIVSVVYRCEEWSGEPLPDPEETVELRWFPIDNLPEPISPPDRLPLRQLSLA